MTDTYRNNAQAPVTLTPSPNGGGREGAVLMVIFGTLLITASFIVPPPGYIDPTVLTAFGEMLTFAGSLIGIDYHYKHKNAIFKNEQDSSERAAQ